MSEKILNCPVCGSSEFSTFLDVKDHFLTGENFKIQECTSCRFKFINPRPGMLEIARYYQSAGYISHDANSQDLLSKIYKIARNYSIRKKYNIVRKYITHGKILDIGCGTGEFLRYCKSKGFGVAGVEPNEKARIYATDKNTVMVVKGMADLGKEHSTFSSITMWHVLEHVHDLNETLEQVKKLLSPDGILIVAVPNCNSWDAREYGNFWAAYDVPRHLYHFVASTLDKLVSNHGFEIRETAPQKLDAFYVSLLSEKYQRGRNNYLRAVLNGFRSNFQAGRNGRGYSSQIFILSLKKT